MFASGHGCERDETGFGLLNIAGAFSGLHGEIGDSGVGARIGTVSVWGFGPHDRKKEGPVFVPVVTGLAAMPRIGIY